VHRSEVYSPRETILVVSPMSSRINFHEVLGLNLMSSWGNSHEETCMSMYNIVFMSVMFLYYE
jgi:hypothetical protein